MPTLTVNVSDEQAKRLVDLAVRLKVTPDRLLQLSFQDLLERSN